MSSSARPAGQDMEERVKEREEADEVAETSPIAPSGAGGIDSSTPAAVVSIGADVSAVSGGGGMTTSDSVLARECCGTGWIERAVPVVSEFSGLEPLDDLEPSNDPPMGETLPPAHKGAGLRVGWGGAAE